MRQVQFRSSHFRPIPGKPQRLGAAAAVAQGLILPPPPRKPQRVPLSAQAAPESKAAFARPRDGVVRAVASDAAKAHVGSHRRTLPAKSSRAYCEAALHYGGRYVVEEFVYLSLNRKVEERRTRANGEVAKLYERLARKPQRLQAELARVKLRLAHEDLARMAEDVFQEIEGSIRSMAANGRRLKERSVHGYLVVRGTIPMHGAVCYVLVDDADGTPKVVRAMTVQAYEKSCRGRHKQNAKRHGRSHKGYSQRPRQLVH